MKNKLLLAGLAYTVVGFASIFIFSSFKTTKSEQTHFGYSANKEIFTKTSTYNVTVQNDMLYFASVNDYLSVLSTEESVQNDFKSYLSILSGFTSLISGGVSTLQTYVGDDYISYIVNSNGCMRVGGNIYKISSDHSSVLVLNSSNINSPNLSDLLSETTNTAILVYSAGENVIDAVNLRATAS